MSKFKSDKVFDLPNGLYESIWVRDRISFWGYGKGYVFFVDGDKPGGHKTEKWEGTVELINGIVHVDDKQGWISYFKPVESTYNRDKGYWVCHGK